MADNFVAQLKPKKVAEAVTKWRAAFAELASEGSDAEGNYFRIEQFGCWAQFTGWDEEKRYRYWNGFGDRFGSRKKTIVVEINPPGDGVQGSWQGCLATAPDGKLWMLHGGQMSISGRMISHEKFAAADVIKPVMGKFPDEGPAPYFPVACLDASARKIVEQTASFIRACSEVRSLYQDGKAAFEIQRVVRTYEAATFEKTGSYDIPARLSAKGERIHADVCNALLQELKDAKELPSNTRVGRWGPDLFTTAENGHLYEVKISLQAHAIQTGLGQLLLYEKMLGKPYIKHLILPRGISSHHKDILKSLDVDVIEYDRDGSKVHFDRTE